MDSYPQDQPQFYEGQQQEQQSQNPLYADYVREDKVNNIIQQLNPDNLVEDIEHRIRGERKNRFNNEWEPISRDKSNKTSELLISKYISYLSSMLNQNTSLSNYSSSEINNLMEMVVEHLEYDLSDNSEDYGFVYINEIEVDVTVKRIIRHVNADGSTSVTYIDWPIKQKKIIDEITDFNEMNRIGMIIAGTTFSVLKRALNGSEARRVFGALRVSESLNQQDKKKGFLESLMFWKS